MSHSNQKAITRTRRFMRFLVLAWAGWWLFFGLASGLSEGLDPLGVLVHTAVPGLIFLALALIAWLREGVGGALLIITALLIFVLYPRLAAGFPPATILFTVTLLALPPLFAGALCLGCWRRSLPTYY